MQTFVTVYRAINSCSANGGQMTHTIGNIKMTMEDQQRAYASMDSKY